MRREGPPRSGRPHCLFIDPAGYEVNAGTDAGFRRLSDVRRLAPRSERFNAATGRRWLRHPQGMVRRLVHLLTALSLLLLVGSLAMWIRGSFTSDVWTRVRVTPASDRPGGAPVVITDYVVSRDGG